MYLCIFSDIYLMYDLLISDDELVCSSIFFPLLNIASIYDQ